MVAAEWNIWLKQREFVKVQAKSGCESESWTKERFCECEKWETEDPAELVQVKEFEPEGLGELVKVKVESEKWRWKVKVKSEGGKWKWKMKVKSESESEREKWKVWK